MGVKRVTTLENRGVDSFIVHSALAKAKWLQAPPEIPPENGEPSPRARALWGRASYGRSGLLQKKAGT